ncbi:uncharacterized protein LOC118204354 [Stegodyphus dumicola]|uniref:uncharacterized protein LOC118204354 n=1 Tax=Stegodyphus dumicola TaxID=202533 RepID=UPI0015AEA03A|nr:uncharacterized protein LOC118204354 [Stegodyphus dumicola]
MISLNDTLEAGPNLLPESIGCLLRFRLHEFAVTCDGKQAFLQLSLHKEDRDVTKFFWYKLKSDSSQPTTFTDEITVYRFTRLPFGPYLQSVFYSVLRHENWLQNISQNFQLLHQ